MNNPELENLLNFVETPVFAQQLAALGGTAQLELLFTIQNELLLDPERGDLVKGLGGARKARVADPLNQRGKSGGLRYLYLYFEFQGRIYLLYLYSKRKQDDLGDDERKALAALAAALKKAEQKAGS